MYPFSHQRGEGSLIPQLFTQIDWTILEEKTHWGTRGVTEQRRGLNCTPLWHLFFVLTMKFSLEGGPTTVSILLLWKSRIGHWILFLWSHIFLYSETIWIHLDFHFGRCARSAAGAMARNTIIAGWKWRPGLRFKDGTMQLWQCDRCNCFPEYILQCRFVPRET